VAISSSSIRLIFIIILWELSRGIFMLFLASFVELVVEFDG
jgi:hypothetical protein